MSELMGSLAISVALECNKENRVIVVLAGQAIIDPEYAAAMHGASRQVRSFHGS